MRITAQFAVLLVTVWLGLLGQVEAAPARRAPRTVTLPLRSLHGRNPNNLLPHILMQQHAGRAERRLARMSGRSAPSEHVLREKLRKRKYIIGSDRKVDPSRFPGGRTKEISKSHLRSGKRGFLSGLLSGLRGGKKGKGNNAAAGSDGSAAVGVNDGSADTGDSADAGAASGAGGDVNAGSAGVDGVGNSTAVAQNGTAASDAGSGAASSDTSQGASEIDIQAEENPQITEANAPDDTNSLGLNIDGADLGYSAEILLGTPPRKFQIIMDSGSADFWVGSENCQNEDTGGDCGNHVFLGPQSSSTFQQTNTKFEVTYGTGDVQGVLCSDNVDIAGLQLPAHNFGVANAETSDFTDDVIDGLMGTAKSVLSEQGVPTPIEALATAGLIDAPIVSYKVARLSDQKNDGEVTFGALDPAKFDNNTLVNLDNVSQVGFWEANLDDVAVDGQSLGLQGRTAIVDTGTTIILAPPNDAAAVHQLITGAKSVGQGSFTVPCTFSQNIALTFGGQSFQIDPRDMALLPVDNNNPTGDCFSGIMGATLDGPNQWLVGDVFLKNAYFSTNVATNQLSLATPV